MKKRLAALGENLIDFGLPFFSGYGIGCKMDVAMFIVGVLCITIFGIALSIVYERL